MELALAGEGAGTVSVSDETFAREYNEPLVHQSVVSYLARARQGTVRRKSRADARGGGRKPFRQKGTGRARAGTIRSPIWRGGGAAFAARPRDHGVKINRKMHRGAMRCILSELVRRDRLVAVDAFAVDSHKTRDLAAKLAGMGLDGGALIVTEQVERELYLAARNLRRVDVLDAAALDPVSLVGFEKVLVTVPALRRIEEMLS